MWYHGWPLHRATDEQVAAAVIVLRKEEAEYRDRGARLCAGIISPDHQGAAMAVLEFWHSQREVVGRCGECSGRCDASKIMEMGWRREAVCRQTGEACFSFRLTFFERGNMGTEMTERRNGEGTAMVEVSSSREVAEIQGAMTIAKRFPRDQEVSLSRILTACKRSALAESAVFQYSKGGTDISGPSIRLAETLAREWGNMQFGIRELEQRSGESTIEAFAIDLETNVRCVKVFQCRHVRFTKTKSYALEDPREIYEMVANQGARRVRNCILGIIPGDVVEAALEQCEATLKKHAAVNPDRIKGMLEKFAPHGVTKEMIEARIQRNIDAMTSGQLVALGKIFNSLKDGVSVVPDWFAVGSEAKEENKVEAESAIPADQKLAAKQRAERLAKEREANKVSGGE